MLSENKGLRPSLALAAMLGQPPGEEEVTENSFVGLLGKFALGLPQPMA